jgi:putative oxidoreductase
MEKTIKNSLETTPMNTNILALVRIAIGTTFLYHGLILWDSEGMRIFSMVWGDKFNIPAPMISIYVAKILQSSGAVAMVLGLFTRIGAAMITLTMVVATFIAHKGIIVNIPALNYITSGEGETAFAYMLLFFCFVIIGPGKFSLDHYLFNKGKN